MTESTPVDAAHVPTTLPRPAPVILSPLTSSRSQRTFSIQVVMGNDITQEHLVACSQFFQGNYGIWGEKVLSPCKPGGRVRMSAKKLKDQCVSDPDRTMLAICTHGDELLGHAFGTTWDYAPASPGAESPHAVMWVTQLVVNQCKRNQRIASSLLQTLLSAFGGPKRVSAAGLVSSHPAACAALAKLAVHQRFDLGFIREHAAEMFETTTVGYLKTAQLKGTLFSEGEDDFPAGAVSSVFTDFYVDHAEPLAALREFKLRGWLLGELHDGYEFLLVCRLRHQTYTPVLAPAAVPDRPGHLVV